MSLNLDGPWVILGDFNETLDANDSDGGSNHWDTGNSYFKSCVEVLAVEDLRAMGAHYTWWDSKISKSLFRELDRVLVNMVWQSSNPSSFAQFNPMELSDHCPAIVFTNIKLCKVPKPF